MNPEAGESIEDFRARATEWIEQHLPSVDDAPVDPRELQARLFDGGFAGIAFPTEYGGAGLTLDHQNPTGVLDPWQVVKNQVQMLYRPLAVGVAL